jgi:wyosine [tRNA(Phe)-imidazoG37] synthetase (radical SAM superfamily)
MSYVFGPVPSRRLGVSLGVDIVPKKYCTLDCLYCEVGKTDNLTIQREDFYDIDEIISEVEKIYCEIKEHLDVVTITGSGEPTLNKSFGKIAKELKKFVTHPVVLLTNSTLFFIDEVKSEALNFDIVIPSLDAADVDTFEKLNKPSKGIDFDKMIDGLIDFSKMFENKLFVEVLLLKDINDSFKHLDKIADILKKMKYTLVQLNTAFRPTAYKNIRRLDDKELLEKAIYLKSKGVKVEPVTNFMSKKIVYEELFEIFYKMLELRPLSKTDIRLLFGEKFYDSLIEQSKKDIKIFDYEGETFFKKG